MANLSGIREMTERKIMLEHVMAPGTGKAVTLYRGQILRMVQLGDGQNVDFNAFNLHDYKEHFCAGQTRRFHGLFPTTGATLRSNPPRDRVMMTIIADTVGENDVNYPRCSGLLYELGYGFEVHTNCQDMLAEAVREYGLTPDDVHPSFNFWMHTGVKENGMLYVKYNDAKEGDYVELIAQFDVLAVVNVCGADVYPTNNFELKPVLVQVTSSTDGDRRQWLLPDQRLKNQQTPENFKLREIQTRRELSRDQKYTPHWPVYPITITSIEVPLSFKEWEMLNYLRKTDRYGKTEPEVLRYLFFTWWLENRVSGPTHTAGGTTKAPSPPKDGSAAVSDADASDIRRVSIRFNQQQTQTLDWLLAEGNYGSTYPEIMRRLFLMYCGSHPELLRGM